MIAVLPSERLLRTQEASIHIMDNKCSVFDCYYHVITMLINQHQAL